MNGSINPRDSMIDSYPIQGNHDWKPYRLGSFWGCRACVSVMGIICLLATIVGGAVFAQAPVITLACEDKTDFPNVLGDGQEIDWKKPGASLEFVKQLGDELGLKVVIKRLPWKRALELELKEGTIDGLFPVSYRKEREAFGVLPMKDDKVDDARSMFLSSYCFYKLRTSPLEWDGKVLTITSKREIDGAEVTQAERWTLSGDGKTLTILNTISMPVGDSEIRLVLEKQ